MILGGLGSGIGGCASAGGPRAGMLLEDTATGTEGSDDGLASLTGAKCGAGLGCCWTGGGRGDGCRGVTSKAPCRAHSRSPPSSSKRSPTREDTAELGRLTSLGCSTLRGNTVQAWEAWVA
mmetsp:Transcript_108207/g.344969  ORF Transcript_108207/g.344969 Transcript_108207/m.344969 type:complete len:121 (-) Transcript_108207:817-1179(-)